MFISSSRLRMSLQWISGGIRMNIKELVEAIGSLKIQVQHNTYPYMMDPDCTEIIDAQLNGYVRAVQSYCKTNNLIAIADNINDLLPIERNAIEFFCFWDGVKSNIVEHSDSIFGQNRLRMITSIAYELQSTMTRDAIDVYLAGFGVAIFDSNYTVNSKRIYVENTLKNVDGIIIMNIAKDLNLFSPDIVDTEIDDKVSSDFVNQQIIKCKSKMNVGDYDGAITNARTLIEEILLSIEEKIIGFRQEYDGNMPALYKRVSKQINMYPDDFKTVNSLHEILRGFVSIVNGFAGVSNNIADRHATNKHPDRHHAKLAVNSSLVLCEFLLESYEYQNSKE